MNGPRIQSDERGITVNKSLAWAMVTGLVAAGVWIGTETASTKQALGAILRAQETNRAETQSFRSAIDTRVRSLESARSAGDSEMNALRRDLTAFREDMRELKELLRLVEGRLQ